MNIMVTGAGGFIGSNVFSYLTEKGYNVIGTVKHKKDKFDRDNYIEWNMQNQLDLNIDIDVIIHTAGRTPKADTKFEDYFEDNILATHNMIRFAEQNNVKSIIYIGSAAEYGKTVGMLNNNSPHNDPDDYGLTKYIAEKMIKNCSTQSVILILPTVIGKGCTDNWISRAADKLRKNQEVNVYNYESNFNNILHITDLCKFIDLIIGQNNLNNKIYLLGANEIIKVKDVVLNMKEILKSSSNIKYIGENGQTSFYIDNSNAVKSGFDPMNLNILLSKISKEEY
ncbi:MAG: NAD(P)-dependent oxidoreductase [Clostridium sp.]|nr:NAD(P)-dependent oxidoreductase [Clostridium sp.]